MGAHEGTVKFFYDREKWGFISRPGEKDVFFHATGIKAKSKEVKKDQPVTFDIVEGREGPQAVNIV